MEAIILKNAFSLISKLLFYKNLKIKNKTKMAQGSSRRVPACLQTHLYRGKTNEHFVKKTKKTNKTKQTKKTTQKTPPFISLFFVKHTYTCFGKMNYLTMYNLIT
jgi:hypothetical protein